MLTKEDFYQNLRFINVGCKLGILPFKVNLQKGELQLLPEGRFRKVACQIRLTFFALHTAYIVLRLPYLLLAGVNISVLFLLWHLTLLLGMACITFWHFTAFFRWSGLTVTCFNKSFDAWVTVTAGDYSKFDYFYINFVST